MVERTPCGRIGCPYPAHVILFAAGGEFDGRMYRRGVTLAYCLKHGSDIYDAIHLMNPRHPLDDHTVIASWLRPHLGNLPTVWADHHIRPRAQTPPWQRSQRTNIPERTRTRRAA